MSDLERGIQEMTGGWFTVALCETRNEQASRAELDGYD